MVERKTLLAAAAAALVATSVMAGEVDLSGATSDGLFGDGSNTVIVVDIPGTDETVIGFGWLLSFEAFSPSWGSEARIDITSPDGTTFTFSGDDAGWSDDPGRFVAGGSTDVFNGETYAGEWTFRFYESFNDGTVPDGIYHHALFVIKPIPAPGVLAVLGVAGVAMRRRRRTC